MKPEITLLTIGVDDLEAAVEFYRDGLGFETEGIVGQEFESGAVAFFKLRNGLSMALFARENIARDAGIPVAPHAATEFTLGHNVPSQSEVDVVMTEAANAGAAIIKPARETFWGGYAGIFRDPDGHLWEVTYNPDLLPGE